MTKEQEDAIKAQDAFNLEQYALNVPTTFVKEERKPSENIYISGKTLRRNYIYQQRDEYISQNRKVPDEETMEIFAYNARRKYLKEGDYALSKITGEATWLGTF